MAFLFELIEAPLEAADKLLDPVLGLFDVGDKRGPDFATLLLPHQLGELEILTIDQLIEADFHMPGNGVHFAHPLPDDLAKERI